MIKFWTEQAIREKVSMRQAIDLMRDAFVQLSQRSATVPVRTVITTADASGRTLFMPSYSPAYQLFGLKMVSVFDGNPEKNLPAIQGNMLVMDGETGSPKALLEAEYLTALRTGAASGLATELLSRKDAQVLAIFGAGAQAEAQLHGVHSVRKIKEVIVFGRSSEHVTAFCRRMGETMGIEIRPGDSPEELIKADVICTTTTSPLPLFQLQHVKEGAHINGIGSYTPSMQEIPGEVIAKSYLVVDQYKAALTEAGDIIIPMQQGLIQERHIRAELGEIISGVKEGRTSSTQLTVFKSVGNAIQDLAIASALLT